MPKEWIVFNGEGGWPRETKGPGWERLLTRLTGVQDFRGEPETLDAVLVQDTVFFVATRRSLKGVPAGVCSS